MTEERARTFVHILLPPPRLTLGLGAPKKGQKQLPGFLPPGPPGNPGTVLRGIRGHLSPWQLEAQPKPRERGGSPPQVEKETKLGRCTCCPSEVAWQLSCKDSPGSLIPGAAGPSGQGRSCQETLLPTPGAGAGWRDRGSHGAVFIMLAAGVVEQIFCSACFFERNLMSSLFC